jgi:uncharacterized protein
MLTVLLALLATLLILAGLAGIVLPFIPAVPAAWLGVFIFAIGTGFKRISVLVVIILAGVMVLSLVLDFFAPMLGAGKYKASRWGFFGAAAGSFLGIITLGLPGIILGPFLGAFLGELLAGRKQVQALKIAWGAVLGVVISGLFKVVVILIFLGVLIASWF